MLEFLDVGYGINDDDIVPRGCGPFTQTGPFSRRKRIYQTVAFIFLVEVAKQARGLKDG